MPWPELADSLKTQRAWLPQVQLCKFHGALYNDAAANPLLAERCADWLIAHDFSSVLCPPASALALAATERGLQVLAEGFADRAYDRTDQGLALRPRSQPGAVHDADGARRQAESLWLHGGLEIDDVWVPWPVDTLCVHSDTADALPITRSLKALR
jgi:UPF0271 protein